MKRFILAAVAVASLAGCGGQTENCKKYIACSEAVSPGSKATLDTAYGTDGTCWKSNAAAADVCDAACESGLTALKSSNPDQAECK